MANEVTDKLDLRGIVESPNFKDQIARVVPKHLTADRVVRVVLTAMIKNPLLLQCSSQSVCLSILALSQLGLEPDGRNAHLIPYNTKKKDGSFGYECQFQLDYKGIVELVMRSGLVSYIHADKVCEGEEFVVNLGQIEKHNVDYRSTRGTPYAYYCIIVFKDGTKKSEIMTLEEVKAVRARSKSATSGPWVTDFDEMAKKTVFKRGSKWVSISSEIRQAIDEDSEREFGFEEARIAANQKPGLMNLQSPLVPREIQNIEVSASDAVVGPGGEVVAVAIAPPQESLPLQVVDARVPEPAVKQESKPASKPVKNPISDL
jgi:recombination protein RecT